MATVMAFAAIYVVWGSTYLAIRHAIVTMPPLLMAGGRFVIAGMLMYPFVQRGQPWPTGRQMFNCGILGGLLLLGGNGAVTWAEQTVPSGTTALLVAMVPFWMVMMNAVRPQGTKPTLFQCIGLILGFIGIVWLIEPWRGQSERSTDLVGAAVIIMATFSWALGSVWAKFLELPKSPTVSTSSQMMLGGLLLVMCGMLRGEWSALDLGAVSARSAFAFAYLVVFGSIVAFSAYCWLLQHSTPARVSTYAYVNPMVAVGLAWISGDEPASTRAFVAMIIIVAGVVLITLRRRSRR
jgi:drug/metabolite transporter (DMT)-like permease